MTKAELINYLKSYENARNRAYDANNRIALLKSQISECKKKPTLKKQIGASGVISSALLTFVAVIIVGAIIWFLCAGIHAIALGFSRKGYFWGGSSWLFSTRDKLFGEPSGGLKAVFTDLLTGALFSSPVALLLALFSATANRKADLDVPYENQKRQAEYEQRLAKVPQLESALRAAQSEYASAKAEGDRLASMGIIPVKYRHSPGTLLEYIEDGRADTLKEAINLWEADARELDRYWEEKQRHEEMMDAIESHAAAIQSEVSRAADAAEDAADAAGDAAFWNAASTFIVASEIDRQRKKDS